MAPCTRSQTKGNRNVIDNPLYCPVETSATRKINNKTRVKFKDIGVKTGKATVLTENAAMKTDLAVLAEKASALDSVLAENAALKTDQAYALTVLTENAALKAEMAALKTAQASALAQPAPASDAPVGSSAQTLLEATDVLMSDNPTSLNANVPTTPVTAATPAPSDPLQYQIMAAAMAALKISPFAQPGQQQAHGSIGNVSNGNGTIGNININININIGAGRDLVYSIDPTSTNYIKIK